MEEKQILSYPTHPSWDELQEGCIQAADAMRLNGTAVNVAILGLARGGLVNAVIFSHLLSNGPVISIDYSSKAGAGDNVGSHTQLLPEIRHQNLLIVDDIIDSGHTMAEVDFIYRQRGHIVVTYASYWKQGAAHTPDYFQYEIPAKSEWIIFPWE